MVATTLTVVSCLHRHASLDSMREVETVQPLASPPTFGGTIDFTRFTTTSQAITVPTARRGRASDRVVEVLDNARTDFLVTAELDAGDTGVRSAAGQSGEQHAVQPDHRGRLFSVEVVHYPGSTVD